MIQSRQPEDSPGLVHHFLETAADFYPYRRALVCAGQEYTYGQLEALANQLAHALIGYGVRRGDRVVIYSGNSLLGVVGIFAVLKCGAAFIAVNTSTRREKLLKIVQHAGASAVMVESMKGIEFEDFKAASPALRVCAVCDPSLSKTRFLKDSGKSSEPWGDAFPASRPDLELGEADLAAIIYTSGSTGDSKGVMCSHGSMDFVTRANVSYLGHGPSDVVLNVLPLSFTYGLYQLLATFQTGAVLLLESSFAYPVYLMEQLSKGQASVFAGVPTIYALMLQLNWSKYDLSALRILTNAAAALPVAHLQEIRRRLPNVNFFSMYGMTETARTLYLPPGELERRPDSVGIALPGTEVWIENSSRQRLGPGQAGELVVRGPHVMQGYWNDPVATALRFQPGSRPGERVCHSGDYFRADAEGFYYFVSRSDDIIKCRGQKISPREIENVLVELPGVVEAAVVGVPDPILGQAIKAVLVPNGAPISRQQVLLHCHQRLENLLIPKYIEFRDSLPKTPSGKVRRMDLR